MFNIKKWIPFFFKNKFLIALFLFENELKNNFVISKDDFFMLEIYFTNYYILRISDIENRTYFLY